MTGEGDVAPDFCLADDSGATVQLSKLKGRYIVVYFYPRDDTPGCTAEAQDFAGMADDFAKAGADIIGISPDGCASHRKFKAKYGLTLRLVADEEKKAAEAYGVWVEKSMYGKAYMGVERSTFVIGKTGRIVRSWRKVKVPGHAAEVLDVVRSLKA